MSMKSKQTTKSSWLQRAGERFSRREFVKAASVASIAVTAGIRPQPARATELPRVSEDDPTAKALNYVHDARSVDAAKRSSSSFCSNCALFAGDASKEWAKCTIFPGKVVAGDGWCSAWAPKPQG